MAWGDMPGGTATGGATSMGSMGGMTPNMPTVIGTFGHDTHPTWDKNIKTEHDYLFNDRRSEGRRHTPR